MLTFIPCDILHNFENLLIFKNFHSFWKFDNFNTEIMLVPQKLYAKLWQVSASVQQKQL